MFLILWNHNSLTLRVPFQRLVRRNHFTILIFAHLRSTLLMSPTLHELCTRNVRAFPLIRYRVVLQLE